MAAPTISPRGYDYLPHLWLNNLRVNHSSTHSISETAHGIAALRVLQLHSTNKHFNGPYFGQTIILSPRMMCLRTFNLAIPPDYNTRRHQRGSKLPIQLIYHRSHNARDLVLETEANGAGVEVHQGSSGTSKFS